MFAFSKKCLDQLLRSPTLDPALAVELKSLTRVALTNKINILRFPAQPLGRIIRFSHEVHTVFPIASLEEKVRRQSTPE